MVGGRQVGALKYLSLRRCCYSRVSFRLGKEKKGETRELLLFGSVRDKSRASKSETRSFSDAAVKTNPRITTTTESSCCYWCRVESRKVRVVVVLIAVV